MLVYRVFPHLRDARPGTPGHPLHLPSSQGTGRWDNPEKYQAMYLAATGSGAIGEAFAHLPAWSASMLSHPTLEGSRRCLGVYRLSEERTPLLDLDDPKALVEQAVRPTEIVVRNRPRTQGIARGAHTTGTWSGLSWWSMHRPQWVLHMLWDHSELTVEAVEPLPGHPALLDAAELLSKPVAADLA